MIRAAIRYYSLSNTQPCRNRCTTWSRNLCEAFKWRWPYPYRGHPAHNRTVERGLPVLFLPSWRLSLSLSIYLSLSFYNPLAAHFARHTKSRNGAAFGLAFPWRRIDRDVSCCNVAVLATRLCRLLSCRHSILPPILALARKDGGETTITTGECFHDGDHGPRRAGFWADA